MQAAIFFSGKMCCEGMKSALEVIAIIRFFNITLFVFGSVIEHKGKNILIFKVLFHFASSQSNIYYYISILVNN